MSAPAPPKLTVIDNIPGDHKAEMEKLLFDLAEQVAAGKISSIAAAIVYKDGNTGDGWSPQTNISTQIGAIERMKYKLISGCFE